MGGEALARPTGGRGQAGQDRDGAARRWPADSVLAQHGASLRTGRRLCQGAAPSGKGGWLHQDPATAPGREFAGGRAENHREDAGRQTTCRG